MKNPAQIELTRDLVLVGGGHAHALVLRRWAMDPLPGARLTLIDPEPAAAYSGMLPGFVAGHYGAEDLWIDLLDLARAAGAAFVRGRVEGIDLDRGEMRVAGAPPVGFDVAALDVGITSRMPDLPGFGEHAVPAKPLGPFAQRWQDFASAAGQGASIAVIGAGVAGAELAMAMAWRLRDRAPRLHLIDRGRALAALPPRPRAVLLRRLDALSVTLVERADVAQVTADGVRLAGGETIPADLVVGAAGATPHPWLAETGLALHDGFVAVDPCLRASDVRVFASGDCAHMTRSPRPKAGVYAVRQAPVLFDNLRAALGAGARRPYRPQSDYLKLISLGGQAALAEKWGGVVAGPLLWRWKDRIDRAFMDKLSDLPIMAPAPAPRLRAVGSAAADPLCTGCGGKVGRTALRTGLEAGLKAGLGDAGPGDDAAVLAHPDGGQVFTTDHLSAVTQDPALMARIAAVHALGDIWAMGARPQAVLATVILPRQSDALAARALSRILSAARQVVEGAGGRIVGGHTAQGDALAIGFAATGLLQRPAITLGGGRAGDALVLTRPLGSGTVLAGAMAGRARGADVAAALQMMALPQGDAADILAEAHAMTDVTGFGLAGHLAGLCAASGCAAEIDLASLPILPGAEALAESGLRSSLWQANRAGAGAVQGAEGARGALLFDPQTAGGLLAAVPADIAAALVDRLQAAGHGAARIGRLTDGPPQIDCR